MPLFVLHRNHILRPTNRPTLRFEKTRATHVPNICVADAVAIGAIAVDGDVDVLGAEEAAPTPLTPDDRKAQIFAVFATMSGREERLDFTASGVPDAKRVAALTGFDVTARDRDKYWTEYKADVQAGIDQDLLDAQTDSKAED
jgi:hypothetical protein